jgi:hypothetical protein
MEGKWRCGPGEGGKRKRKKKENDGRWTEMNAFA